MYYKIKMAHTSQCLSLPDLKRVYNGIRQDFTSIYTSDTMIASLKATALENFSEDNESNFEVIQQKNYALKCLLLVSAELDKDFCLHLYNSLLQLLKTADPEVLSTSAFDYFNQYIQLAPSKDSLLILQTVTICLAEGQFNFTVFEQFSPDEWRRELLFFSLIKIFNANAVIAQRILSKVNDIKRLEVIMCGFSVEDILESIVFNAVDHDFDLNLVIDIFATIPKNPFMIMLVLQEFDKLRDALNTFKLDLLSQRYNLVTEWDVTQVKHFLKYPIEVIITMVQMNCKNFLQLVEFKNLLEVSDMDLNSQVEFILQLQKENFSKCLAKLGFEVVRNIISQFFTEYDKYSRRYGNKKRRYFMGESPIACTCFKSKCVLHHTTECCDALYVLNEMLAEVIFNCSKSSEKVIEVIGDLIGRISNLKNIYDLVMALEILYDYDVKFTDTKLEDFFNKFTVGNFERQIHKHLVAQTFHGSYEKTIDQLLDEIENTNPEITSDIIELFDNVQNCCKNKSSLIPNAPTINLWNADHIKTWAASAKRVLNQAPCAEMLAVIKQTVSITLNIDIRHVQLLAIILLIKSKSGQGRLAQINTGEGKTIIIAVLAAYHVLRNHKVDVYTSSSVLAIPQARFLQKFYECLLISATDNIKSNTNYEKDVIYGTNHSFQRDVLRDEFRQSGIRKNRGFDIAIVDEVDNMLIDGNNWILMLSTEMPAMDYLEPILAAIYMQVNEAARCLVERDGQVYCLVEEDAICDEGEVKREIVVQEVPIRETKREFILKYTEDHMRKLIRDTSYCKDIDKNYPEIKVPKHLREIICKIQLKKWISNAVSAVFYYVNGEDYIIKDGKITIVDADNTGVIKKNSHWNSGLHQHLEIKHGAKIHPENFTSNYISNVGLFTRYSFTLYGLTGTLGSKETRLFLHSTYNVDSIIIPPFKLKQHKHLSAILFTDTEDKYLKIANSCMRKLRNGQAALIILKYVKETTLLADVFTKVFKYDESKIKLVQTDDDSELLDKVLNPGEVVITTNVAGRGTDIKLNENIEKSGGLHVCLCFLPLNSRVEEQNIGRTSRKGNRGTSQLVIHDTDGFGDITKLKNTRDNIQATKMTKASEIVKSIKNKERMFRKFCSLLATIKGRNSDTKKIDLKAVEERFSMWLIMNEDNLYDNDCDDIDKSFDNFQTEIQKDDRNDTLIKNPCMYIELGNNYLKQKKYEKAIYEYNEAIITDKNFSEFAYYNRAWAYMGKYGGNVKKNEHLINEAINDLKIARKLMEEKEYSLHLLSTASKGKALLEQVSHKLNLYSIQKSTIDMAIGPDKDALDDQLKKYQAQYNTNNLKPEDKNDISDIIEKLEESKNDFGIIGRAKSNDRNIEIESIGDDFMIKEDKKSHEEEIKELQLNGWLGAFKIKEIKPIDWGSVISLLGIGLGQLIIGAALTVFTLGAGASIGMGFISEGVGDIITAVKDGIINRDFDWKNWALMKVISIAVSIVCAGFKAIKDAAKTAYAGAKNVLTVGAKALNQTTKAGWKIVAQKIGLELGKGVAKEIATELVTYGVDKTIVPMIEEKIIETVRNPIQNALLSNPKVKQMLLLDQRNGNRNYENQIRNIASTYLTPEKNSMLKTISMQIATKFADQKGLGTARLVQEGIIGSGQLLSFTDSFINNLNKEINKIELQDGSTVENSNFDENNADYLLNEDSRFCEDDVDLSKINETEEQVNPGKRTITTKYLSLELASMASQNMLQILKGKIMAPITRLGVNYAVDKMFSKITDTIDKKQENYRSLKNVIRYQNKAYKNQKKTSKYNEKEMNKVNKIVDDVKNGGPAGLLHLGAISDAVDRPIEVYDSKGRLKFTIGDNKNSNPVKVQYHEPENGSGIGHFTLDGNREPQASGNSDNMCLFNVIAEQTGQNPKVLKNSTLKIIQENKEVFVKQVQHINRLEMYDKTSLLEGGAQYNGKCPDDAGKFLKNSDGVIGHGQAVEGHPDRHIPFKRKTIDRLNATNEETGRQIEVYDSKGNLSYVIGEENKNLEPIKLQYHKPKGDSSAECFSALGSKEMYFLHDPNDTRYYEIINQQIGSTSSPENLRDAINNRMDSVTVPPNKRCIENYSKTRTKHAFKSEGERDFVTHYALKSKTATEAMAKLNEYEITVDGQSNETPKDSGEYIRQELRIPASELNLPREAYGGEWKKGKPRLVWKVQDVLVVLQHYPNQAGNKKARVHIQTIYPIPPGK